MKKVEHDCSWAEAPPLRPDWTSYFYPIGVPTGSAHTRLSWQQANLLSRDSPFDAYGVRGYGCPMRKHAYALYNLAHFYYIIYMARIFPIGMQTFAKIREKKRYLYRQNRLDLQVNSWR